MNRTIISVFSQSLPLLPITVITAVTAASDTE